MNKLHESQRTRANSLAKLELEITSNASSGDAKGMLKFIQRLSRQKAVVHSRRVAHLSGPKVAANCRNTLTAQEIEALIIISKGCCHYCGQFIGYLNLTLEHVQSIHSGGHNEVANVVMACRRCNLSKGYKRSFPNCSY